MRDELPEASSGNMVEALRVNGGLTETKSQEFTTWMEEQMAPKETCYIGNWSLMPDLHVEGPDALQLFKDLTINSFEGFEVGKAKHAVQCNKDGKVIADGVLTFEEEDKLRIQNLVAWPMYNAETGGYDVTADVKDSFIYQVQGPNALAVLEKVTDDNLREVNFMNFKKIDIKGHEVIAVRQGMAGEIGFELHGPREIGEEIYYHIFEAGQEYGIRRLGSKTRHINLLENCFPTQGFEYLPAIYDDDMKEYREWLADFDEGRSWVPWKNFNSNFGLAGSFVGDDISDWYMSPVELGWGHYSKFDHDFVGKEALKEEVENPSRKIVTLVWDDDDVIDVYKSLFEDGLPYKWMELPHRQRHNMVVADEVRKNGELVGITMGRGYSYYFREMISLCTIDLGHHDEGTEVTVIWGEGEHPTNPTVESHRQKEITATVAPAPYKEDNRRADLSTVT